MAKPRRARHAHSPDRFHSPQPPDRSARRQALLDQAKVGSREALGELLGDYLPLMRSFFSRRLSREIAARTTVADLVQEACLNAVKGFGTFIGDQVIQCTGWLMTICQRVLAGCQRAYQRAGAREFSLEEPRAELRSQEVGHHPYGRRQASAEEIVEQLEAAGQMRAALAALPEHERRIVKLHFIAGLSFRQVADFLALSIDIVKRACKRIVARLRQRLMAVVTVRGPG